LILQDACDGCRAVRNADDLGNPADRLRELGGRRTPGTGRNEYVQEYLCSLCGANWAYRYQYDAGTGHDNHFWLIGRLPLEVSGEVP
jgi:hypothetical protein